MHISKEGLDLIKSFEGCKLRAYQCSAGVWTIGWGTTSADVSITGTVITPGMTITQAQADDWLRRSTERKYEPLVAKYDYIYHWTQNEFDALVSYAYNIGSIKKLVDSGNRSRQEIIQDWLNHDMAAGQHNRGLRRRRVAELALFIKQTGGEKNMPYDVEKVIKIAKSEVGYLEKKSGDLNALYDKKANAGDKNYTKYGYEMHKVYPSVMDYPAYWCDCFVDWCFLQAYGVSSAKKLLGGNFDDYTVASADLYRKAGGWIDRAQAPQKGDQIFFTNGKRICHTGLVVDYIPSSKVIVTVEGNTSDSKEIVPNGGAVCMKYYPLGHSRIAGYGRPVYGKQFDFTPHWEKVGDKWYYREAEGKNAHGWRLINHHWYYFDNTGLMLTGWQQVDGLWYFMDNTVGGQLEGALWHEIPGGKGALGIWDVA